MHVCAHGRVREGCHQWQKMNDTHFIYTGSRYYEAVLSKAKSKRKDQNVEFHFFENDFASDYAMGNVSEDRAETFAFMVDDPGASGSFS